MREAGVRVLTVREILSFGVEEHIGARVELEELAMRALTYHLSEGVKLEDLREEVRLVCVQLALRARVRLAALPCQHFDQDKLRSWPCAGPHVPGR